MSNLSRLATFILNLYSVYMPELPEVQTTTEGLRSVLPYLYIKDVWTDLSTKDKRQKDSVKNTDYFEYFKKEVTDKRILDVRRRGKNILIELEGGKTILIHMKMTGHLMFGKYDYDQKKNSWKPHDEEKNEALRDPFNRFVHVAFTLSNPALPFNDSIRHLVFCDSRKFGKMTLLETKDIGKSVHLEHLGPEPLDEAFTKQAMIMALSKKPNGKIKQVLMDQSIIAGIGNIYSDEILWISGIHPEEKVANISLSQFGVMYEAIRETLRKGIDFGGDSTSDYRDIHGKRGEFHHHHNAYRKTGDPCGKPGCKGVILRKMVGGRSAHFCSEHQKLISKI